MERKDKEKKRYEKPKIKKEFLKPQIKKGERFDTIVSSCAVVYGSCGSCAA